MARTLFFTAGLLMLLDAIGYSIGVVGKLQQAVAPADDYLRKRLQLNLMLANAGLYFTAFFALAGATLESVSSYAGHVIMAIAFLACLYSAASIPLLTPRDWKHAVLRGVAAILILVGLLATS
jgi:hypothetical protein